MTLILPAHAMRTENDSHFTQRTPCALKMTLISPSARYARREMTLILGKDELRRMQMPFKMYLDVPFLCRSGGESRKIRGVLMVNDELSMIND